MIVENQTIQEQTQFIEIRVGDDYLEAFQREFHWQILNRPELVGGVPEMSVDGIVLASGTVTDGGFDTFGNSIQDVKVEVTSVQSALLVDSVGIRRFFSVQVSKDGAKMVEISGTANVLKSHP